MITLDNLSPSALETYQATRKAMYLVLARMHEMVGVVEEVGSEVKNVKPGDRVTVNVETYCGECYFCKHRYVNNCTSPDLLFLENRFCIR